MTRRTGTTSRRGNQESRDIALLRQRIRDQAPFRRDPLEEQTKRIQEWRAAGADVLARFS